MNNQKLVQENVEKLTNLIDELYQVRDKLNDIIGLDDSTLKTARDESKEIESIIDRLNLLRHDLRDDYGNGYRIIKND